MNRPTFYYGFEFEGMVLEQDYISFVMGLRSIDPHVVVTEDNSIKKIPAGYRNIEFCTRKLPEKPALIVLEEMLSYLWLVSQEKIFLTNSTCGFHVNMSEKNIFERGLQLRYYSDIILNFNEKEFLKKFRRERSTYCRPFKSVNKCETFEQIYEKVKYLDKVAPNVGYYERVPLNKKYYAVALRENPANENEKNHRIEFRFIGNKDYHLREKDLTSSMNHILSVSENSFKKFVEVIPKPITKTISKPKKPNDIEAHLNRLIQNLRYEHADLRYV